MDQEIGLGELITQFIGYELEAVHTAIPAVVLRVNNEGRQSLVDVQPLVSILQRSGEVVSQSSILNVPLSQPASSVGGMVFPVKEGDNVLLVFSEKAIDRWKYGTGVPTAPSDFRKFNRKDCIAIPCIFPANMSMANEARQGPDYAAGDTAIYNLRGGSRVEIVLKQNGDVVVNSPKKVIVNCVDSEVNASNSMTVNTQDYKVNCTSYTVSSTSYSVGTTNYSLNATGTAVSTGTYNMNGSFVLNSIPIETHTHGGVQTGGGSTGGPQ